ncbi:uncharacterized protein METZ01_LOCUS236036 [marine metagenome]|uniref:DUF3429 domain-containing protein n=1 Tax=marine metagenome TaxID=408172 RepID=A0A382H7K0_9ZZZZ
MLYKLEHLPRSAGFLSALGLVVFFGLALTVAFGGPSLALNAYLQLVHFGALVLSFVAAIQWGLGIAASSRGMSIPAWWFPGTVFPMILAWLALALLSPVFKIFLLALGFVVVFVLDTVSHTRGYAPTWYKGFRKFLTIGVLVSLLLALVAIRSSFS